MRRAQFTVHYKAEVLRLDRALADAAERDVVILVDRALRKMAAWHGSADVAVAGLLCDLAMLVRGSWSVDHVWIGVEKGPR